MSDPAARSHPESLLAHVEWVRRLARVLVADAHDAADVEQETWRQALERPPAHAGQLRHWLATVARNVARKLVRSQSTREHHERAAATRTTITSSSSAAHEVTARADLHRRVVDAVLRLDEIYRAPLLLRFFDDLTAQEVAERLALPLETARTRIKRGIALVRERLGGELGVEEGRNGWVAALAPLLAPRGAGVGVAAGSGATAAATTAAATTAAAATTVGASWTGIVLGGAIMSKLVKVGALVVVAGAAVFGSYHLWIAPKLAEPNLAEAASNAKHPPEPAAATDRLPDPAAASPTREHEERGPGPTPATVAKLGTIEGTVLDASGQPVAGAIVALDHFDGDSWWNARNYRRGLRRFLGTDEREHTWRAVTSALDGSFRFEEVDPEVRWGLGVLHEALGTAWSDEIKFAGTPPLARVPIVLTPGVVLYGTVRDPLGKPVEAASVMIAGERTPPEPNDNGFAADFQDHTNTDAEGNYRSLPFAWRHVRTHVYVYAGRPDLAQLDIPWEELPAGVTAIRRDLTVPSLTILNGRILGPDGNPVRLKQTIVPRLGPDAQRTQTKQTIAVAAFSEDPRTNPRALDFLGTNEPGIVFLDTNHVYGTLAIADDRYEVPLRQGGLRFVAVIARNRLLGVAEIAAPPAETDVTIDPGLLPERSLMHNLRLHFRDGRDGSPLSGVVVHAQTMSRTSEGQVTHSILNFGVPKELAPDRELELPRTPLTIEMHCKDFVARSCSLDPRRADTPGELTFEFLPLAGSIVVHLADEDDQPIAGAWVQIQRVADLEAVIVEDDSATSSDGDCTLAGLPSGDVWVVAHKDGYVPAAAKVSIDEGESPVDLEMLRGYEVTLDARLPDGTPAPPGQFSITSEEGVPLYDNFRGRAGAERLSGKKLRLVDGTYTVRCAALDGSTGSATFTAAPGATIKVELEPAR